MNDDIKLLSMLLRYSERRMVVSLGLLQAHWVGDATAARAVVARLARRGLLYIEGPTVRLTLPGFALAVSEAAHPVEVRRLHERRQSLRSRAA
jgi:hypothetical protein